MNASRIGCRLILVFLVAICVVWSQVSDAAANDWDETSHDWDQMVEADGSGDVKASADEKWGYQAAPVAGACSIVCVSVFLFERIDA